MKSRVEDIFGEFLGRSDGRRVVVACPADAAGMAAGEMARRCLASPDGPPPTVITPQKGELLTGSRLAERARAAEAQALLALDLGAAAEAVLPDGPTLFIDHHRHQANLSAGVIEPAAQSDAAPAGVVLYRILRNLRGADAEAMAWLAAIAAESGHPKIDLAEAGVSAAKLSRTALREAAVLLNSAGRASELRTDAALRLLARSDGPRALLSDESPERTALGEARAEVMREVGHWSRTRPHFMWRVALVPVASPCRIEPILAAMWERQLERYMVVAANSGYVAGLVTVVARTASKDRDLLRLLDAATPDEAGGLIALGRRDYVEAVMPRDAWKEMLRKMRFRRADSLVPPPQEAMLF